MLTFKGSNFHIMINQMNAIMITNCILNITTVRRDPLKIEDKLEAFFYPQIQKMDFWEEVETLQEELQNEAN